MFKKWLMVFTLVVGSLGTASATAQSTENPYKLIQRVAEATFKRISTDNKIILSNPNHLKVVVEDELMPYVNYKLAAKMVLGKTKASKAEKKAFYKAFRGYLITTYATVFTKYTDQKVVFEAARNIGGKKVVTVKTRIIDEARPDIHIDFKVRLNKKTGVWKAYDMIAEGISLLNSKKAELKGLLRQSGGVANVTELLKRKSKLNIKNGSINRG
jgi:phospholipid transport system substrate-binding protein